MFLYLYPTLGSPGDGIKTLRFLQIRVGHWSHDLDIVKSSFLLPEVEHIHVKSLVIRYFFPPSRVFRRNPSFLERNFPLLHPTSPFPPSIPPATHKYITVEPLFKQLRTNLFHVFLENTFIGRDRLSRQKKIRDAIENFLQVGLSTFYGPHNTIEGESEQYFMTGLLF